uniref:MBD domain-containing protein n=1 Tax=Musa acuminata subsp. malaccensis TaxID=214687 RepID=A0A804ISS5_MUSAM
MASEERPDCASPEVGTTADGANHLLVREVKDSPDWLPSGWVLETRTQKNGAYAGREIKCYYNPSTGSRFYSKKQVFRHLNARKDFSPTIRETRSITSSNMKKPCTSTSQEKSIKESSSNNVCSYAPTGYGSNELPHGWIKEIRFRKYKRGKPVNETLYIDPDGEYAFRSLKDAFRYIETGDVNKCASKPQKRSIRELHTVERELHPAAAAKRLHWRRDASRRCLFPEKGTDSDVKMATEINKSPQWSNLPPSGTKVADSLHVRHFDGVAFTGQTLDLGKEKLSEPAIGKPSDSVNDKLSDAMIEAPKASQECSQLKQFFLNDECLSNGFDEMQQANMRQVKHVPLVPLRQQNGNLLAPETNSLDETNLTLKNEEQSEPKKSRGRHKRGFTRAKAIKPMKMPLRASKRLAALRGNQMSNSGAIQRSNGNKSASVLAQSAQSDLVNKRVHQKNVTPIIDLEQSDDLESHKHASEESNAKKQVQSGRSSSEKPLAPYRSPFGDSWPDPCLEFAFKMLTSDIPVFEETGDIQEYFHQALLSTKNSILGGPASLTKFTSSSQSENLVQMEPWGTQVCFRSDGSACSLQKGQQSSKKAT